MKKERCQAVVKTERAREHTVSKADLCNVVRGRPAHTCNSRNTFGPGLEVVFGISYDCGLTRGAAGGVDSDKLVSIDCKESEGIVVSHILLCNEGEL